MTLTIADFYEALTGVVGYQAWRDDAACKGLSADLFFSGKGEPTHQARAVCAECPVQPECLEHAQAQPERFGLWAGLSERQRRVIRRHEKLDVAS